MQANKVPVVVYENGKRYEVGEAAVIVDGKNIAIMGEALPGFEEWMLPDNYEISLKSTNIVSKPETSKILKAFDEMISVSKNNGVLR